MENALSIFMPKTVKGPVVHDNPKLHILVF